MSYSDTSRLLDKQAELRDLQTKYDTYINSYKAIPTTVTTTPNNKNAISNTNPPSGILPGDDFGQYWKFISSGATNPATCWSSASRDPRVFQKVVYTGDTTATNNGDATWNNKCYGLIWDAPIEASNNTDAPGYSTMVSNVGNIDGKGIYYTKLGINTADNLDRATQIADLKTRIDSLIEEIAVIAGSSINSELTSLTKTSADKNTVIQKINQYMNSSTSDISEKYKIIDQRKNMNNVYEDINNQITLNSRKYKFVFYFLIGLVIIMSYMSYVSKLTIMEQISTLSNLVSWGWWANWGIITFVVILLIISSLGWDMKGNITMIFRYITDPTFWVGEMWWVGVSFLFLFIVFFYASFKSFFVDIASSTGLDKLSEESSE